MKKYIVSVLVVSLFLVGAPFIQKASAADMSIKDFINLLIIIGVIPADKIPAVNAYLATFNNSQTTTTTTTTPTSGSTVSGCAAGAVFSATTGASCSVTTTTTTSNVGYNASGIGYTGVSGGGYSQPSITVLSPNGGESYDIGSAVPIRWTASNLPAEANNRVSISLAGFNSSGDLSSIQGIYPAVYGGGNGSVINNGSSLWAVPSTVNPGSYKIRINGDCPSCFNYDDSDNYFTITTKIAPPTVVVPTVTPVHENMTYISPSGGIYQAGSVLPIRLSVTGFTPDGNSSLSIQLYNSSSFVSYIFNNNGWTSSLDWDIPTNLPAGEYTLLVNGGGLNDGNGFSVRSVPFTISASSGGELAELVGKLISQGLVAQDKIAIARAAGNSTDLNMTKFQFVEFFITNGIVSPDKANEARAVFGLDVPVCSDFVYSDWASCDVYGYQDRTATYGLPIGCQETGGHPTLRKLCN